MAVAVVASFAGIEPSRFTLDPAVLAGFHPLLGVVSNVSVLLWAAAATICLFTAAVLRSAEREPEYRLFLFSAGILTTWLLLDDFFLFHEWLLPNYLGVPQAVVLAAYVGLFCLFLLRFVGLILRTGYLPLALALSFFAMSLAIDQLPREWFSALNFLYLVEDGAKLLGIVGWLAYFGHACSLALSPRNPRS